MTDVVVGEHIGDLDVDAFLDKPRLPVLMAFDLVEVPALTGVLLGRDSPAVMIR